MCLCWGRYFCLFAIPLIFCLSSSSAKGDETTDLIQRAQSIGYAVNSIHIENGIISEFFSKEFFYKPGLHNTVQDVVFDQHVFKYRLHVPDQIEAAKKYPLIVWLHGCGDERGWDNTSQLQYMEKTIFSGKTAIEFQFYLLVPQCPLIPGVWFQHITLKDKKAENSDNDMLTVVSKLIDKTIAENPVDPDRVTLVGISCSASTCLEMGVREPQKFAALLPLSLGGIPVQQLSVLPHCPIWIFNNSFDEYMDESSFGQLASSVAIAKSEGANIAQTILHEPDWKHDSWSIAFQQYDLLTWLLQQSRSQSSWYYPPGVKPGTSPLLQPIRNWTMSQLLTEAVFILGLLTFAVYIFYRVEIFETRGKGLPQIH